MAIHVDDAKATPPMIATVAQKSASDRRRLHQETRGSGSTRSRSCAVRSRRSSPISPVFGTRRRALAMGWLPSAMGGRGNGGRWRISCRVGRGAIGLSMMRFVPITLAILAARRRSWRLLPGVADALGWTTRFDSDSPAIARNAAAAIGAIRTESGGRRPSHIGHVAVQLHVIGCLLLAAPASALTLPLAEARHNRT
jgi:hypothetical protein